MLQLVWRIIPFLVCLAVSGCGVMPIRMVYTTSTQAIPDWDATITFPPEVTLNPVRVPFPNVTADGGLVGYFGKPFIYERGILDQATLSVVTDCQVLTGWNTVLVGTPKVLPPTTTVEGRLFRLQSAGAVGSRHQAATHMYVYQQDAKCLGLGLSTYSVSPNFLEPPDTATFDQAGLEKILLNFINTLHFNYYGR